MDFTNWKKNDALFNHFVGNLLYYVTKLRIKNN